MADVLHIHADVLLREIERLKALYPELEDDPQLLADMVEGSTRYEYVLNKLSVAFLEKVALKEANALLQTSIRERGERFDRAAEGIKGLMMALMRAAGQRTAVLPSATLSIAAGRARLVVDDDFHAQGFMRVKEEPMKAEILTALKAGSEIPGARLEQSPEHIQVRK